MKGIAAIFLILAVLCIGMLRDEWEPDEDEPDWTGTDRKQRRSFTEDRCGQ
jgi:hypothetical protein